MFPETPSAKPDCPKSYLLRGEPQGEFDLQIEGTQVLFSPNSENTHRNLYLGIQIWDYGKQTPPLIKVNFHINFVNTQSIADYPTDTQDWQRGQYQEQWHQSQDLCHLP